jgi:SAM-dependent methyltransferase
VSDELHQAAATGFARGAAEYERGRPGYPDAAIDWLSERLELREGKTVVDLAAGTGKLTRLLARTGARVIAVEPVAEMRALIEPPAEVLDGTAELMPLADSCADAITVAQAFHWFDHRPALAEMRRVLVLGGALAVVWNRFDDDDELNLAIRALIEPYRGDAPHARDGVWEKALEDSVAFELAEERKLDNPQHFEAGALGERVSSISFISSLPHAERERVTDEVRDLAGGRPVTLGQATHVRIFRAG